MLDSEAPLSPVERLVIASLYASLAVSQNRSSSGQLDSESPCYADLNISSPRTLSHKGIPVIRPVEGFRTDEAC
ncbi:hypothetical protein MSTE_01985 [Mycobacteroides stephanolepidis]|uniref:Uncharacterized protein n=1 Tax=[Mycobacterium] stephanolepidis TaxID=1520670 RepID=A0A1Z4EWH6_9MYCO|nr:hypothetical protein MSTE_01985 [[Mycobacterium] stephanolepidis]